MHKSAIAFVTSALLVVGLAASTGANDDDDDGGNDRGNGRGNRGAAALISGNFNCGPGAEGSTVTIDLGGGFNSVVIGLQVNPDFPFVQLDDLPTTCEENVAALAELLPSPLCSTRASSAFGQFGRMFTCSGDSAEVVRAVGDLLKNLGAP